MARHPLASLTVVIAAILAVQALAQPTTGTPESHIAAAKAAAGNEHTALFEATCVREPGPPPPVTGPRPTPERSTWHYEPVKVFDNLYYIGEKEYSAWAVVTSAGIIVIDTIWAYSVEDEIVGGLKKLGFDPAQIKYALVSHAHIDHIGGAKYLQEKFGARVVMSAADWDFAERSTRLPAEIKPKRDVVGRRREAHARRHHADALSHARPHAGHDLDDLHGEGRRAATHTRRDLGRHVVQLRAVEAGVPDLHRLGGALSGRDRRPRAPTSSCPTTRSSTARTPSCPPWRRASRAVRIRTWWGSSPVQRYVKVAEECARAQLLRQK